MHTGPFQKAIAWLLVVSFIQLSVYQSVWAVRTAADTEVGDDRSRHGTSTVPYKAMGDEDSRPIGGGKKSGDLPEVSIDIEENSTLLTLLRDDPEAVIELKKLVQGLPSTTRRELRSLADLQEYVDRLGPKGTAIKWTLAVFDGTLKTGGLISFFMGADAVSGMLNAPFPEGSTTPSPKMQALGSLAGVLTLPDTIGGSEKTLLSIRRGLTTAEGEEACRLIAYCKKKGATHIVIRGVVDGGGATVLVVLTIRAFLEALTGVPSSTVPLLLFLGSFYTVHQGTQSARRMDEVFLAAERAISEHRAPAEVKHARHALNGMVMDAFRRAVQEPEEAREEMHKLRELRNILGDVLAELDALKTEVKEGDLKDLMQDRLTAKELEMLSELFMVEEFNKDGKYRPKPPPTKWYDYVPLLSRIFGGNYSKLYRAAYTTFAAFTGVGSYIAYYGYTYAFQFMMGASGPIGGITAALMSIYLMDLAGKSGANVVSGYAAYNPAMDMNTIEKTHTGSKSLWSRIWRPTVDFLLWAGAGFKTLPETGAAAVGAGYLMGNTPADHNKQMAGIIALATGHGAEDNLEISPVQEWLSRIQEYRHGSGAQAYKDYLARLREGLEDLTNEEAVRMHKALEEFGTLVHRLLEEYRDKKAAGKAAELEAELKHAATAALHMAQVPAPVSGKKEEGSPPDSVVSVTGSESTVSSDELTREIDSRRSSPDGDTAAGTAQDHSPSRLAQAPREREMREVAEDRLAVAGFDSAPLRTEKERKKKKKKQRAKAGVVDLRMPLIPADEDEAGFVYHDALSGDEGLELTPTTSSSDGSGSDNSPQRGSPPIDAVHSTAVVPSPQAQRGPGIVPQRGAGVRAWISDKFHGLMSRVSLFGVSTT